MQCDMCGREAQLYKCRIEGTHLNLCNNCSKHGEKIHRIEEKEPETEKIKAAIPERTEIIQIINPEYPKLIRRKREAMELKQKELGKRIAEKESVIHKLEAGSIKPDIDLARKLERFLKIRLVQQYEEKGYSTSKDADNGMTIGDLIKIKKR